MFRFLKQLFVDFQSYHICPVCGKTFTETERPDLTCPDDGTVIILRND